MRMNHAPGLLLPNLPRRRFVQGLAAGGVIAGLGLGGIAPSAAAAGATALGTAPVLRGTEFDLVIDETPVNFTGKPAMATTVNGMLPGPTLRWREGDTVTLRVTNRLREPTSIHWHGILLPFQMDGVPGLSFHGIAPGETFTYRFQVRQSGSYWYHSHSGFQEMTGVYGGLIIDPAGSDPIRADRDYTVLLADWTDEDPMRILAKLKTQSDYYNYHQPTVADFFRDVASDGWQAALAKRRMWTQMRMSPTDLADLSGATLTHLANGITPAGNWTGLFAPGRPCGCASSTAPAARSMTSASPGSSSRWCRSTGRTSSRSRSMNSASARARPATCWSRPRTTPIRSSASRWIAPATRAARWPCAPACRPRCRPWTRPSGSP